MKKRIVIISIILLLSSFIIICFFGNKNRLVFNVDNTEDIVVNYDKNIIQCVEKKNNNSIELEISPVNKGKTRVNIEGNFLSEVGYYEEIVYVHAFGIITVGNYFGHCQGDITLILSINIIMIMIIIYLIKQYKISLKQGLNNYTNIGLLGLIIFITVITLMIIYWLANCMFFGDNLSLFELIFNIKNSGFLFSIILFPIAFIVSIMVTIFNIILLKREGITWKNMLGTLLGGSICIFTIIISILEFSSISYRVRIVEYFITLFMMLVAYLECVLLGTIILSIISGKHIPKFDKDFIIILGCMIKKDGTLTPLLKARVDRAIEFSKMQKEAVGKDIIFVPSGGKGSDEIISEAEAMKNYLIKQGIDEEKILIENKSTNTFENIKFSNEIIKRNMENANIAYSTTNYHVFRAGVICNNLNIKAEGIGAKTKSYYLINAFIREFIATLVLEKRTHIKMILLITIILLIMEVILYLSSFLF